MSQAGILNLESEDLPGDVALDFVTNDGTAEPVANILNVIGGDSSNTNNEQGIETAGGLTMAGLKENLRIRLTNRVQTDVQTVGATTATGATLLLSARPDGIFVFEGRVGAYNKTDNAGASYRFTAAVRVTSGSATEIAIETKDVFEEASMTAANIDVKIVADAFTVEVTGFADGGDKTINWNTYFEYSFTDGTI